ncbi:MAG: hypothetical protein JWN37_836 [Candidatus Nomurabacteria bacterium]|nr:hypothetical protein [Candidatus Nomurabacteria bacterium]
MSSEKTLPQESGYAPFEIIGAIYIVYATLAAFFLYFASVLNCSPECNTTGDLWYKESILTIGFLLLTIVELRGILKRQLWAKWYGIIIPLLFIAQIILIISFQYNGFPTYTMELRSLHDILHSVLFNPFIYLLILCVVGFLFFKRNTAWIYYGKRSLTYLIILSLIGIALVVKDWKNYYDMYLALGGK